MGQPCEFQVKAPEGLGAAGLAHHPAFDQRPAIAAAAAMVTTGGLWKTQQQRRPPDSQRCQDVERVVEQHASADRPERSADPRPRRRQNVGELLWGDLAIPIGVRLLEQLCDLLVGELCAGRRPEQLGGGRLLRKKHPQWQRWSAPGRSEKQTREGTGW